MTCFYILISSTGPKAQVGYSDQNLSVVYHCCKLFTLWHIFNIGPLVKTIGSIQGKPWSFPLRCALPTCPIFFSTFINCLTYWKAPSIKWKGKTQKDYILFIRLCVRLNSALQGHICSNHKFTKNNDFKILINRYRHKNSPLSWSEF